MTIGVFDSGIGGLTVLKALIKKHPNNHYIYYGDNKNLPYGDKSPEELLNLSSKIIDYFIKRKVDLIIIACGTISSTVYPILKEKYDIPLIDIISPTLHYFKNRKGNFLVLATSNTINSHIFKQNIPSIIEVACPDFVPIIEDSILDTIKLNEAINKYLLNNKPDGIILGCTHYPLIKSYLEEYLPIKYYDMGEILSDNLTIKDSKYKLEIYFSNPDSNLEKKVKNIISKNIIISKLDL